MTLRVYKEGCLPSDGMFFLFFFTQPLCYISESQRSTPTSCARESHLCAPESIPNSNPEFIPNSNPESILNLNPCQAPAGSRNPPLNSRSRTRTYPHFRTRSYPALILRHEPDYAVTASYRLLPPSATSRAHGP